MKDVDAKLADSLVCGIRERLDPGRLIGRFNREYTYSRLTDDPAYIEADYEGQFLSAATEHGHTDLVRRLLNIKVYISRLAAYPDLVTVAMDAGNIQLLDVLLGVGVPFSWKTSRHVFPHEKWYYFRSAVQCACYWDRPDVLKRLVAFFLKERYEQLIFNFNLCNILVISCHDMSIRQGITTCCQSQ